MPSILVELGFISTPEEERYLNTENGTTNLANGIYRAFLTYKREQEMSHNGSSNTPLPEQIEIVDSQPAPQEQPATRPDKESKEEGIIFKIQILTSSKPLSPNDKRLKGVKDAEYYKEGGLYKYTCGASKDYNQVLRTKRTITTKFKDAFIIAFKNGKKTDVNAAIREFKQNRRK